MKQPRTFGKAAALLCAALALALPAFAWGPERPAYTMAEPADHAVFNSITDNAAVGDERDFVRIVEKGTGGVYSSDLTIEPEKEYEVFIYYDNDASPTYNDEAHGYAGVARDVRVAAAFPTELAANERGKIFGRISASNTDPLAVWDEAYVTAAEDMTLHYVEGSAKIYNQGEASGAVLPAGIFSDEGTFLGIDALDGVIPCSDEYASGQVVYTIQTHAAKKAGPGMAILLLLGALLACLLVAACLRRGRRRRG